MKKKAEDTSLKKYPYLKKYLEESNQKYNLDSSEDLFNLFNIIIGRINKKRDIALNENDKKNK